MSGWPWPLDGVQNWFENLWNQISRAAVSAVSVVSTWIRDAVAGLWTQISGAFSTVLTGISKGFSGLWTNILSWGSQLWTSFSSGLNSLWSSVAGSFSSLWTQISSGFSGLLASMVSTWTQISNSISQGINSLGSTLSSGLTHLGSQVTGGFGSLWTNFTGFITRFWNDVSAGIGAVGAAVGSAVNTIGSWVSETLKGMATALGTALQGAADYVWSNLRKAGEAVMTFISADFHATLAGALNWIRDAIFGILRSLWASITSFFGGFLPVTPEKAAGASAPLLLIGAGAGFGVSVMGAVASTKALGSGIEARAVTDFLQSAFALGDISRSIIMPILSAAYSQPVQYWYNSVYRPYIIDTRTADQMLFEGNLSEAGWRQTYRYHGWKEADIDAWAKTVWNEPNQRTLIALLEDPDVPEEWIRRKLRENGFIGEDADRLIEYGRRRVTSSERLALATQVEKDMIDGVITAQEMAGDLTALKFTPEEIAYRVAKADMIQARNIRRAVLRDQEEERKRAENAAKEADREAKKIEAAAKAMTAKLTEGDLTEELKLGLRTPQQYIADLVGKGYAPDLAERKYRLETTPRPLTTAEIQRRRGILEDRIAKTRRRFDFVLARHDLQVGFMADTLEYLLALPTPPATRIATLQAQIAKAADEKALILEERDLELADLEEDLKLVQAG